MSKSNANEQGHSLRAWGVAIFAVLAWALLAANSAEAQSGEVPDFVVAQVLGARADRVEPLARPRTEPRSASEVNLVAARMREDFEAQLVAGVSRPSVELEVHFDFDSDEIHEASAPQIEAAAEILNQHFPQTRFRVAGFTDAVGSAEYNQVLSERRAVAVWRVLVEEHGVDGSRLERLGFGEDDPEREAPDEKRRRVELQILRSASETL